VHALFLAGRYSSRRKKKIKTHEVPAPPPANRAIGLSPCTRFTFAVHLVITPYPPHRASNLDAQHLSTPATTTSIGATVL
jgi:hypothetical protein